MSLIKARTLLKKGYFKSVGIYIFTNFFSKAVSFLLIPLFTNPIYLTPTDNGLLSLFSSNLILLAPIVSLGMIQSSMADFYKKSREDFSVSFTSNFLISASLAILATVVLFCMKDYLIQKFGFPPALIYVTPLLAFLIFSGELLFGLIRNRNEVKRFAVMSISKSIIEYTVSVILIVFFFTGWKGRVWGIAISLIAVNVFAFFYFAKNKYLHFSFRKKQLWEELKFGLPVMLFQLCVFMLGSSQKVFLALFDVDKAELGIYSIACIFGAIIGTISQSITLFVQPQLYKSISSGAATLQSIRKDFLRYFKMLTGISAICIAGILFLFYFVIDKTYLSGIRYFFIVAAASYIWGLNYFLFLFLLYHKQKRQILLVSLVSITLSFIINFFMVKNFLIMGDALAGLINTVIFSGLIIVFFKKNLAISIGNKPVTTT